MSFEQGQKVTFTTSWGEEVAAEIIAVLPEDSKYSYVVEYTDADDGEQVADFADEDDLEARNPELTLTEEQLTELHSILRVASADHAGKFPKKDCRCLESIQKYTDLVSAALGQEA